MTTNTNNRAATIRPGLLVNVKSTVAGGVSYKRVDLAVEALDETTNETVDVARWETVRTIEDKDEYERATKVRSKAISLIRKQCQATSFGLLCPEEHEGALDVAIRAAREMVDTHNASAVHTRVQIYALKGRVASNDAEAARAITSEIADLVVAMDKGIAALDADAIRKAADRAREMSAMLDESLKVKVDGAIAQARKAARDITRRLTKNGEEKAVVLADIQRGQIESARIAFLDMSESTVAEGEALPVVEAQRFADLDLSDVEAEAEPKAPTSTGTPTLDLAEGSEPVAVAAKAANVPMMELS